MDTGVNYIIPLAKVFGHLTREDAIAARDLLARLKALPGDDEAARLYREAMNFHWSSASQAYTVGLIDHLATALSNRLPVAGVDREAVARIIRQFPMPTMRASPAETQLGVGWCNDLADALLAAPKPQGDG